MKRGQMEIAGLVIIVILITLGMLFALLFFVKKGSEEKQIFVRKGLAYSTMGAMLRTSVPCQSGEITQVKMVDLLEDCARFDQFRGGNIYQCREIERMDVGPGQPKTVCLYAEQEIQKLLRSTLDGWDKNYRLTIGLLLPPHTERQIIQPISNPPMRPGDAPFICTGEQDSSGIFPEQTEVGIIQSQLVICG